MVADGGEPSCKRTSVATVNVNRNLNDPRFTTSRYTASILETHPLSDPIVRIEATDDDDRVSSSRKLSLTLALPFLMILSM